MTPSKIVETILFGVAYSNHLLLALALWLAGEDGNIMLGILLIVLYRLSLWFLPAVVTLICWLPLRPRVSVKRKLLFNLFHLGVCASFFLLCNFLFGNWY